MPLDADITPGIGRVMRAPRWHQALVRPRAAPSPLLLATMLFACADASGPVLGVAAGDPFYEAARLALSDDAAAGGPLPIDSMIMQSSSARAEPAIEVAQRLVAMPGMIAVVGHTNSAASLAASQIYNQHEVVQMAPSTSATIYSEAGPYSFRLVPPDRLQGSYLADYLDERFPGARLALLYVNDDYGRGLALSTEAALRQRGVEPALMLPHMESDTLAGELDATLAALETTRPQVVVWLGRAEFLARALPRIRSLLGDVPVVGGDAVSSVEQIAPPAGGWSGVSYVDFVDVGSTPALRSFRQRYKEQFGVNATGADALTYDAVRLLIAGVRDGARTGPELRAWLETLGRDRPPYQGITGPVAFDEAGDILRAYVVLHAGPGAP